MKRLTLPIIALCIVLISFVGCTIATVILSHNENGSVLRPQNESPDTPNGGPRDPSPVDVIGVTQGEFRAVWVATVLNLDFPSRANLPAVGMKREIDAVVANTANMGLNAIILQVRPTGDAFYESDIFPWSEWLSGEQGLGISGFDPLDYWIRACRDKGIELHAWLNPYRIIHTTSNSSDPETLSPDHPVRINPALAVAWSTSDNRSGLFLDPGLPEARQLILDGITELITKYDIDGVHIDDYFYPGEDFNDSESYAKYGNGMELDDWRRENVNTLIKDIQAVIREHNNNTDKNVRWGVSPTAIWKNGSSDPLGIPTTRGQESYHAMYADTRRWVMEEWVDYICPQIYWYIGFDIADFDAIFTWWSELCAPYNVDLYIGHAAYREFEDNQPPHWQGEIVRQLEMISQSDTAQGSVFYRYFSLRGKVGRSVRSFYEEKDGQSARTPVFSADSLSIGFPTGDVSLTGTPATVSGYNIVGASLPDTPLYLNGDEVKSRTEEGFFHVFAPLEQGDNIFTFSQDGQDNASIVITLNAPVSGGATPAPAPQPTVTSVTGSVYAKVISDEAWVYPSNSTSNGFNYMLSTGQLDRVVAESSNGLIKLSCGAWVRSDAVETIQTRTLYGNVLKNGTYRSGDDYDIIEWSVEDDIFPAAIALYDGTKLTVSFGLHTEPPPLTLPAYSGLTAVWDTEGTIFSEVRNGVNDDVPFYEFTLKEDSRLEGYYFEYEDSKLRLCLKKRKVLSESAQPLEDITIMLDPGHGGDFSGAIGPMGYDIPEKHLALIHAQKLAERLEGLGATVILTRNSDVEVSLQERVNMSRDAVPDLFLSLHVNSIAETTNARDVRGFTVWYSNPNSIEFSETALDIMFHINPGTNRQRIINQANFVVCRPWWSPHVLLEASFMMSIEDYAWLIDPAEQDRMADATVDVILEYFS